MLKRNKLIIILIFILYLIPLSIKAENCTAITGTGTSIGDEIVCGTEHFYIISNDGENAKMLAKYNLLVGENFYRLEFEDVSDNDYTNYESIIKEKLKKDTQLKNI